MSNFYAPPREPEDEYAYGVYEDDLYNEPATADTIGRRAGGEATVFGGGAVFGEGVVSGGEMAFGGGTQPPGVAPARGEKAETGGPLQRRAALLARRVFDRGQGKMLDMTRQADSALTLEPEPEFERKGRWLPTPQVAVFAVAALLAMGGLVIGWQIWNTSVPASEAQTSNADTSAAGSDSGSGGSSAEGSAEAANSGADFGTKAGDAASVGAVQNAGEGTGSGAAGGGGGTDSTVPPTAPNLLFPGASGSELVVHITGAISKPGVVHLLPGARVIDALEAAGGSLPEAQLTGVNLARVVSDGEQLYIPRTGENPPAQIVTGSTGAGASGAAAGGTAAGGAAGTTGAAGGGGAAGGEGGASPALVNLNTADSATLQTLPGIGPAMAQRIIDYRSANGNFRSLDDLDAISGIGPKLLARLQGKVTI